MMAFRSRFPCEWKLVFRLLLSCFSVLLSHLALAAVPRYFPALPLLVMLPISGVVLVAAIGLGRCCRGLIGISAHAPASVLFHKLFLWGIFASVIRRAVTTLSNAAMNLQLALLMVGLYRIIFSDPGAITDHRSQSELIPLQSPSESRLQSKGPPPLARARLCRTCNIHVLGFDHHCPAFGNCIGRKNHRLFMALLLGFIIAEASYVRCAMQYIRGTKLLGDMPRDFVISTMIFSLLQIFWQAIFMMWHVYCICFNLTTDEWINWRKYPDLQEDSPFQIDPRFRNPYDNGVCFNITEFLRNG